MGLPLLEGTDHKISTLEPTKVIVGAEGVEGEVARRIVEEVE